MVSFIVSLLAGMVAQLREQVCICLMKKREGPEADETVDKMWQLIQPTPYTFDLLAPHYKLLFKDHFILFCSVSLS
jgi:hypothetical protein